MARLRHIMTPATSHNRYSAWGVTHAYADSAIRVTDADAAVRFVTGFVLGTSYTSCTSSAVSCGVVPSGDDGDTAAALAPSGGRCSSARVGAGATPPLLSDDAAVGDTSRPRDAMPPPAPAAPPPAAPPRLPRAATPAPGAPPPAPDPAASTSGRYLITQTGSKQVNDSPPDIAGDVARRHADTPRCGRHGHEDTARGERRERVATSVRGRV
jgi:hypothetical protein